ncbi:MAG: PEP/pyruvate-binding domain-containing protein [Chloroflexota bacterium]
MPDQPLRSKTSTIDIYIKLAQYPILADQIRSRMRQEIFRRGIIDEANFEAQVKQKAIESQRREGVFDPLTHEPAAVWQERKARVRDYQTDFYFGFNLPSSLFDQIIQDVLREQPTPSTGKELSFNPELAPWELLFRQGAAYEALPPHEQEHIHHHLEEIKAVLIKGMISDQLPYIGVARRVFEINDLRHIHQRRIGRGKIGGKAAGMLLAWKILQQSNPEIGPDISQQTILPESYFIGTDVIYQFRLINNLDHLMNQKYRPLAEIRDQYPIVVKKHLQGRFPIRVVEQLRDLLDSIGQSPLIVRSSSLLEDSFGFSFAGKYDSVFCPNQGSPAENLDFLLNAIRRIYASSLNPDAILYRQNNQLIDYDERMAILLQTVRGSQHGRYFLPSVAGVGFSQNNLRWHPDIRKEDGFLRMVWGLGTRAVDRSGDDYVRMVALSHPKLRPETTARSIRQYSQHYVDVIDLKENRFKTMPARQVLKAVIDSGYPQLRYVVSIDHGDYISGMVSSSGIEMTDNLLLTFDYLTNDRQFVKLLRTALMRLEQAYERPVDVEFTVEIEPNYPQPAYKLHILQCRPLSQREIDVNVQIPTDLAPKDIIFNAYQLIPNGRADGLRYVIFVDPKVYSKIADQSTKLEIGRAISRLNKSLEGIPFIIMGPGRWGSANIDLGVRVTYADIYNTRILVEMSVASNSGVPSLSYGTHFYQDLVEAGIYSLPLHLADPRSHIDWSFFRDSENVLAEVAPDDAELAPYLRLIDIPKVAEGRRLTILMDGSREEAIAFLESGEWKDEVNNHGSVSTF